MRYAPEHDSRRAAPGSFDDDIVRITGGRMTEMLPDLVITMADKIQFIYVAPAEPRP